MANVASGGPADAAGLKPGDVVTKIAGRAVETSSDLVADVSDQAIGGDVVVDYKRDGAHTPSTSRSASTPSSPPAATAARIGVALQTLTEPLARSLGLDPRTPGARW